MESKAKLFGHPLHPVLIVLPLGLLSAAVVFDVIYLVTGEPAFATVAFWNIAAGVVGGLLVGVDPGANLDAPSSLSGEPATAKLRAAGRPAGRP